MSKSLYQKYRPNDFKSVLGQDSTVKVLEEQIKQNKIRHAYLFEGCRGTGKTSIARIFARAINCTDTINGNPCNKCASCTSSLNESNVDIYELDAASHNGVDDIRSINEQCHYTPSSSKYRIYIIDEVHMLSIGAFNALLKTLEEPPAHVIFILCTTEKNKLPATITSRCQRYTFNMISVDNMVKRMQYVCGEEGFIADTQALKLIAKNAGGAMRDALSILDTCSSLNLPITEKLVQDTIGIMDNTLLIQVAEAIINKDIAGSLKLFSTALVLGKSVNQFMSSLLDVFRDILVYQVSKNSDDINNTSDYVENISKLVNIVDTSKLSIIVTELSDVIIRCKNTFNPRQVVEAALIKIATLRADDLYSLYAEIKQLRNEFESFKQTGKIITVEKQIDYITAIPQTDLEQAFVPVKTVESVSTTMDSTIAPIVKDEVNPEEENLILGNIPKSKLLPTVEEIKAKLGTNIIISSALSSCTITVEESTIYIKTDIIAVYLILKKYLTNTLDMEISLNCYENAFIITQTA